MKYPPSHKAVVPFKDAVRDGIRWRVVSLDILTYLWCVFRTHGNAETMEMLTATTVRRPVIKIDLWKSTCSIKIRATRNTSHKKPETAHPE